MCVCIYECIYICMYMYVYIYIYMYVYVYFQLIVLVYKDEQQKVQITLCKKNTDKQSYLHAKSNHPVSLKKVYRPVKYCVSKESVEQTANSRAIVKCCMSILQKEVMTHLQLKPKLRRLNFQKIKVLDRKDCLIPKTTQKGQVFPLTVTYNRTLSNVKQIIQNYWSILKTNKALEKFFSVEPIIAFRKNKGLKQLIEGSTIQNDKNIKKSSNKYEGKCTICKSGIRSLCRLQIHNTHSFRSQQNGRICTILHQVNCKSDFVIYLLECKKCHIQYVGKAETDFNLRLNNHRQDVYKGDSIPASRHFAMKDHIFNRDVSFIII